MLIAYITLIALTLIGVLIIISAARGISRRDTGADDALGLGVTYLIIIAILGWGLYGLGSTHNIHYTDSPIAIKLIHTPREVIVVDTLTGNKSIYTDILNRNLLTDSTKFYYKHWHNLYLIKDSIIVSEYELEGK